MGGKSENLTEEIAFPQSFEGGEGASLRASGESEFSGGNSYCENREVAACLVCLRDRKEAGVDGTGGEHKVDIKRSSGSNCEVESTDFVGG